MTIIHHGTPITPREALLSVCAGRATCVSFWRPDDAEAVEAISPTIMFRQRRLFRVDGGHEARGRVVHPRRLDTLFPVVGATPFLARSLGCHTGCARRAVPAQRQPASRVAVRSIEGRSALAHGWSDRSASQPVRPIRSGLPRLDRASEARAGGMRRVSAAHGRSGRRARQSLARPAYDARDEGGLRLSIRVGGQHVARAERPSLRLARSSIRPADRRPAGAMGRKAALCRQTGAQA